MPAVVRSPRTLIDSFSVIGSPSSGAASPRARCASAAWAWVFARSKSGSTMALSAGLWRVMRRTWRSSSSTADTCLARSAASIAVAVAKGSIVMRSSAGSIVPPRAHGRRRISNARRPGTELHATPPSNTPRALRETEECGADEEAGQRSGLGHSGHGAVLVDRDTDSREVRGAADGPPSRTRE